MEPIQLDHTQHQNLSIKNPVCYLAHDIDVAVNIGNLFRIADALGVEKIYLTGRSSVPPNRKIKKTSRSTEKYVPYYYEQNPLSIVQQLKSDGYKIISLEITSTSIDIRDFPCSSMGKVCLILGSENAGVSQELLDVSDCAIHIPMLGHNSSMNVVTACSIVTFEFIKKYIP